MMMGSAGKVGGHYIVNRLPEAGRTGGTGSYCQAACRGGAGRVSALYLSTGQPCARVVSERHKNLENDAGLITFSRS
ncbi:hypothetical protein predicted by Glimmer/Critica [Acetobacter senegalensis]|uniref:Uncharacterized protein n=1 Tax=Acetobacter senegalensis TaxID=446692 RepID=A0A0U5EWN8_9PROT|nr:hypothetical protein predicted by Glimmer/Critica [Acetobacter senegalensis]